MRKIFPNIIRALKMIIINFLRFDFKNIKLNILELFGIFSAICLPKSFHRP